MMHSFGSAMPKKEMIHPNMRNKIKKKKKNCVVDFVLVA